MGLDGFGGVAVGADAERILPVDFEQVGGLVENAGDGFVVHGKVRVNKVGREDQRREWEYRPVVAEIVGDQQDRWKKLEDKNARRRP